MKKITAIILTAAMLCLTACSRQPAENASNESTQTSESNAQTEETGDKVLKIAQTSKAVALFYTEYGDAVAWMNMGPIYETLLKIDDDGYPAPYLCDEFLSNPEDMTYTIKLKEGIEFSDGSILNAEACAWAMNYFKEAAGRSASYCGAMIEAVATDEYTVEVRMSEWDTMFPYNLTRELGMMQSKEAFDKNGIEWCYENPIGTGPFVLTEWQHDISKRYEKNANYWNGEVNLDAIEIVIMTDPLVAQASLLNGEIDMFVGAPISMLDTFNGTDGFSVQGNPLFAVCNLIVFGSDVEGSPLSDVLVRKAICHAIDNEAINKAVYYDLAIPNNQLARENSPYYDTEFQGYEYNPQKARELLKEAGYENGFSTTLYGKSSVFSDIAPVLQSYLAEVGIDLNIELQENAIYNTSTVFGVDEGMIIHTMYVVPGIVTQYVTNLSYRSMEGVGLGNTMMLHPEELDEAIMNALYAGTREDSVKYFKEATRLTFDKYCLWYPTVMTPGFDGYYIVGDKVVNGGFNTPLTTWSKIDLVK